MKKRSQKKVIFTDYFVSHCRFNQVNSIFCQNMHTSAFFLVFFWRFDIFGNYQWSSTFWPNLSQIHKPIRILGMGSRFTSCPLPYWLSFLGNLQLKLLKHMKGQIQFRLAAVSFYFFCLPALLQHHLDNKYLCVCIFLVMVFFTECMETSYRYLVDCHLKPSS